MRVLVDADACPVKEIIVEDARKCGVDVIMFFDTAHIYSDGYSTVHIVDKGADSVDFALINHVKKGDLVITQDYGVASMALGKGARAMNQNGKVYTSENIMPLLHTRFVNKQHMKSGRRIKGPKKRSPEDDQSFRLAYTKLLLNQ